MENLFCCRFPLQFPFFIIKQDLIILPVNSTEDLSRLLNENIEYDIQSTDINLHSIECFKVYFSKGPILLEAIPFL
jgi:hypothetical protein